MYIPHYIVYQDGGQFYGTRWGETETKCIWEAPYSVPDFDSSMAEAARRDFEHWATANSIVTVWEPL